MSYSRNTPLRHFFDNYEISVRAFNICERVEIETLNDLHNFVARNGSFKKVRGCGNKTNTELLEFHQEFFLNAHFLPEPSESLSGEQQYEEQERIPEINISPLVKPEFERLSVRAQNALLAFFDGAIPGTKEVYSHFVKHPFKPEKLRNVGNKTVREIDRFQKRIMAVYYQALNNELSALETTSLTLKELTGVEVKDTVLLEKFIAKEFPIITFSCNYLEQFLGLDELDAFIVRSHFYLLDKAYTLQEIGDKFDVSGERVRQKRKSLLTRAAVQFSNLKKLIPFSKYTDVMPGCDLIEVPAMIGDPQLPDEIKNTGVVFFSAVLGWIFNDEYYAITPIDKPQAPDKIAYHDRYRELKNIKGSYLIRHSTIPKEKLMDLHSFLLAKLCQRQEENSTLSLRTFLKAELNSEVTGIISKFLRKELGVTVLEKKVIIPRNTSRRVYEYVQEALLAIGKPAHITEIFSYIKNNYPELDSPEGGIRAAMINRADTFIYFGRTSTFGLKIWEEKFKHIKGGTIRDIVQEFLQGFDQPCHITAITQYVNQYRKTDQYSVINNLRMAEGNRFTFFKDGYVGLTSKNYGSVSGGKIHQYQFSEISVDELLTEIFSK